MSPPAPVAAAVVLALLACGGEAGFGNGIARVGEIGPDRAEGLVRRVGNQPFARTVIDPGEDGDPTTITGPYGDEIGRLAGATVRVTGHLGEGQVPGRALAASSYEILSIDGDRPIVGTLRSDDAGFFLESPRGNWRVAAVSAALGERTGALVWVVLDENEGVARYGILRDPK